MVNLDLIFLKMQGRKNETLSWPVGGNSALNAQRAGGHLPHFYA
jgi:hypothetical protein